MKQNTVTLEELTRFVESFLDSLEPEKNKATLIGLKGNLGAGKTTFTKTLAQLLGIDEPVTSPTFVIQKEYPIQFKGFTSLIHIDAYRLEKGAELEALGFSENLTETTNLIVLEWPENVSDILPKSMTTISFEVAGQETRLITFHDGYKE